MRAEDQHPFGTLDVSTQPAGAGVSFTAQGCTRPVAQGTRHRWAVLGLRDESTPYPLAAELTVGHTGVKADGTITSLLKFSAMDMRLVLRARVWRSFSRCSVSHFRKRALTPLTGTSCTVGKRGATRNSRAGSGQRYCGHFPGRYRWQTPGNESRSGFQLARHRRSWPFDGARPGAVQDAKLAAHCLLKQPHRRPCRLAYCQTCRSRPTAGQRRRGGNTEGQDHPTRRGTAA